MRLDSTRRAARVECDLAGDPHKAKRPFAKAIQSATWGRTGRIADALSRDQRTVETWGNPTDPQRGPNQTLAIVMHESLDSGAAPEDALAPLYQLAEEFGFDLAPRLPMVRMQDLPRVDRLAARSLQEVGEAISGMVERALDGRLSEFEREQNRKELREAIESLHALSAVNENAPRG